MQLLLRSGVCAALVLLGACNRAPEAPTPAAAPREPAHETKKDGRAEAEHEEKEGPIELSEKQIAVAGIEIIPVRRSFAGAIDAPAVIAADPRKASVIAPAVGGRVIELRRNLGEPVARGDVLAVIESPDAAQLKAEVATSKGQFELAQSVFLREERLYREKVSSQQEYAAARAAAQDAKIRADLAEQRLAAAGGSTAGAMNRLQLRSPISGFVTARQAAVGDMVAANADLFHVADLAEVSVELALPPDDAARVAVGSVVDVSAGNRTGAGRIAFLSRVIDPATRQVRAIATLPNIKGSWRIGETVRASIPLAGGKDGTLAVPRSAIQTVEDKPSVFVRVKEGFAVKHVVLGPASAGYVAVVSGLEGDERIAASNSYVLKAELGKGEAGDHDD